MVILLDRHIARRLLIPGIERKFADRIGTIRRDQDLAVPQRIGSSADAGEHIIFRRNDCESAVSADAGDKACRRRIDNDLFNGTVTREPFERGIMLFIGTRQPGFPRIIIAFADAVPAPVMQAPESE